MSCQKRSQYADQAYAHRDVCKIQHLCHFIDMNRFSCYNGLGNGKVSLPAVLFDQLSGKCYDLADNCQYQRRNP